MKFIKTNWRILLIGFLLAGSTLATFWPVFHSDFINYDDPDYVTENPEVCRGVTMDSVVWAYRGGHASNWHPLTWISHMLDVELFGLNPTGHHLTNLLLHIANTLLLFALLKRMTGALWRGAFVAALFALHPLHVESVAWVAERKDVLSAFFFFLTLLAYHKYVTSKDEGGDLKPERASKVQSQSSKARGQQSGFILPPRFWYVLALVLFALGLMSKPMLVTLPFVLLLLDFWPLNRFQFSGFKFQPSAKFLVLEKLPFFGLSIASSAITFLVQHGGHATAIGLPLSSRLANSVASYWKYLGKTFWPVDLAVFYPHPDLRYPISHQWPLPVLLLAGVLLAVITVVSLRRLRTMPWMASGWLWYLGMLVPVIGIVQVGGQAMADRYTYLPLVGVFIIIVWNVTEWLADRGAGGRIALGGIGLAVILACAGTARHQTEFWRNNSTLFNHALAVTKDNPIALNNAGCELIKAGNYPEALSYFKAAVEADPKYAEAQCSLGYALEALGRRDEAIAAYREALRFRPWHTLARNSVGTLLWKQGRRQEALTEYQQALLGNPSNPEVNYSLGIAMSSEGRFAEAQDYFIAAIRGKLSFPEAVNGLGRALAAQGKLGEAQAQFREVIRLCPTNSEGHLNLGNTLWDAGKTNEAQKCFANALGLEPNLPERNIEEGESLAAQGDLASASVRLTIAARLKPDAPDAHAGLGRVYAQQGRLPEAVAEFREALRLRPDAQAHYDLALALTIQKKPTEAFAEYQEAIKERPDWPVALNDLAWLLATSAQAELRSGPEAVRLAKRACDLAGDQEPRFWGTLAAGYAEAGRFDDAVRAAQKAIALATEKGLTAVADRNRELLELYRQGKPYHEQ